MADKYGNLQCSECQKSYAPIFKRCPHCCPHNELELAEEWHGQDEGGGWELGVECSDCGRNYDFPRDFVINNFKLVRKRVGN